MRCRSRSRESARCVPVTSCTGAQGWTLTQTNSCCCLEPPPPDPACEYSPDFYTQLLGPTADETLLSGYATLKAMVEQFRSPPPTNLCKCCKCGQRMNEADKLCCKCGTPKKKRSWFSCRKSTEKIPSACCIAPCAKPSAASVCSNPSRASICASKDCAVHNISCTAIKCKGQPPQISCTITPGQHPGHPAQCKCYQCCPPPKKKCFKRSKECIPKVIRCTVSKGNIQCTSAPDCICQQCCPPKKKCCTTTKGSLCCPPKTIIRCTVSKDCLHGPSCICAKCCATEKKCCKPKSSNCSAPPDCQCPRNEPPPMFCISDTNEICKCGAPAPKKRHGLLCLFKGGSKRPTCPAKCAPCNCGKHLIYFD